MQDEDYDQILNVLDYYIYDYDTYLDDNTSRYSNREDEEPQNIYVDNLYQFSPEPVLPYDDKFYRTFFKAPRHDHSESLVLPPVQEVIYHSDSGNDLAERVRDKKSLILPTEDRNTHQTVNFNQLFVPSRRIQVLYYVFSKRLSYSI